MDSIFNEILKQRKRSSFSPLLTQQLAMIIAESDETQELALLTFLEDALQEILPNCDVDIFCHEQKISLEQLRECRLELEWFQIAFLNPFLIKPGAIFEKTFTWIETLLKKAHDYRIPNPLLREYEGMDLPPEVREALEHEI